MFNGIKNLKTIDFNTKIMLFRKIVVNFDMIIR